MLFIANALPMNGGTTFLIRICKELLARGVRPGVLVLFNKNDPTLVDQLNKYADIYFLSDFAYSMTGRFYNSQLGIFLPLRLKLLYKKISKYENVHVMGVFGLLFFMRIINSNVFKRNRYRVKLTVGIYHQNEFMYEAPEFYFSQYSRGIFKNLYTKSVIFFNENSVSNYSEFFNIDYVESSVLPVGVNLDKDISSLGSPTSNRIVSIGQLYNFKTYNKHVIGCMPELLKINSNLVYEIYGEGPEENALKRLAIMLNVQESVDFKGTIDYSDMPKVLDDCLVFIGSGTAIIEASVYGIPSVIGIESCEKPLTYGFFSSAKGFSYHEYVIGKQTFSFEEILKDIITNDRLWELEAIACKAKAGDFTIEKTVDGFLKITNEINYYEIHLEYSSSKSLFSFLYCSFLDLIGLNKDFSNRRDQGFLGRE